MCCDPDDLIDNPCVTSIPASLRSRISLIYITDPSFPSTGLPIIAYYCLLLPPMSSSAQGGAGGSQDKPPGLTRFMRRASKVIRRSSSKKESFSSAQEEPSTVVSGAAGESIPEHAIGYVNASGPRGKEHFLIFLSDPTESAKPPATEAPSTVPAATSTSTATPSVPAAISQSIRDIKPSTNSANARLAKTAAASSAIQEEKARALFAKYGLTLAPGEWTPPVKADAERVEKKIRMRIHRTCHHCQTTFGTDKTCRNCKHTRCKKCPRYPTKASKDGKGAKKVVLEIAIDDHAKIIPLTMQSRTTGKDLQRKTQMQRVRRTCHMCNSLFAGRAVDCANCKHQRCHKCPRDPYVKFHRALESILI